MVATVDFNTFYVAKLRKDLSVNKTQRWSFSIDQLGHSIVKKIKIEMKLKKHVHCRIKVENIPN